MTGMITAQEARDLYLEKDPKKHELLLNKLKHKIWNNKWKDNMHNDLVNILYNILFIPPSQINTYITIYCPENNEHWNNIFDELKQAGYNIKITGEVEKLSNCRIVYIEF